MSRSFIGRATRRAVTRTAMPVVTVLLLATAPAPAAQAETAYVSDELEITFRSSPSNRAEIIRILRSGTRLEVLERDPSGEWARVTSPNGTEGWVRVQYLADQPIARDRLEAANREVTRLRESVTELRQRLETVQSERTTAQQSATGLTGQVSQLEQELAEIKRVSAGAIETAAANRRLEELNARLRDEMTALVEERDQLRSNAQQRWLMIGGGLVLVGLLLGAVLKSRPRRSAWT